MDINKLLVPAPPAPTDANNPNAASTDSMNLAKYRSYAVFESWFKSFSDGSGEFQDLQFSLGAEYTYNDQFSVRAGYFYENKTKGNRKYFTVGAGLKYQAFGLNFSYLVPSGQGITRNPLSNTIRFGLVFDLSGGGDKK
jgi:predicted porin